jgi:hypothetical protein
VERLTDEQKKEAKKLLRKRRLSFLHDDHDGLQQLLGE